MNRQEPRTIVFITGAFLHHSCWEEWTKFFERQGYTVIVPPWPNKDAPPDVLRSRHPDAEVAAMRLARLSGYFKDVVMRLAERPVVIGHSIGGLIAQQLLSQGLASKAVAIHSVPPQGVFVFSLSFLKAGWPALGFFTPASKTFMINFRQWQYGFANGMPQEWQEREYCLAIPESKRVVRDTIGAAAKVDFRQSRGPLLLVAGDADHTIPAKLNFANYRKYASAGSVTDYKLFPGRNHGVLLQPGWEEVASYILDWLKTN
jgi:pimeloyl-ACP methyl ester carboxylesterase